MTSEVNREDRQIDVRVALAGAGAFDIKHLEGLQRIDGVEGTSTVSRRPDQALDVARRYGVGHTLSWGF